MLMAKSTYEGMKLANPTKRPFVLTRAGFIGQQRYAAMWTGDNVSNWEHLHMSIAMVLQLVSDIFMQVYKMPPFHKKWTTLGFVVIHFLINIYLHFRQELGKIICFFR